jgi:hypothetical protein
MGIDSTDRDDQIEEHIKALEHRLSTWRPAAGALDRDRMLYDAGQSAARADSRIQVWRLATAALLFLTIGLSGLLARQSSLVSRERSLLAHDRMESKRTDLPATFTASGVPAESWRPPVDSAPVERFAPASYFVLTSRFVASGVDASWHEADGATGSHRRDPGRPERAPAPAPLRPRDVQRVLDL